MRISDWSSDVCSSDLAAWDRAGSRRAAKLLQPCIQSSPALGQPFAGSQRHGEPRGLLYRLWRDLKLLEVAIAARSRQPYVTGPEGVADVEQHRDFPKPVVRSEEHTSELQSLMRTSYAVFCLKKKKKYTQNKNK